MTLLEGVMWLALNLYHEGRGESKKGQMAIVYVVMNRAEDKNKTIKEVILEPYQFSWTLKPEHEWKPKNKKAYLECIKMVYVCLNNKDFTEGALYFHNKTVYPKWAPEKEFVATYGTQLFYRE